MKSCFLKYLPSVTERKGTEGRQSSRQARCNNKRSTNYWIWTWLGSQNSVLALSLSLHSLLHMHNPSYRSRVLQFLILPHQYASIIYLSEPNCTAVGYSLHVVHSLHFTIPNINNPSVSRSPLHVTAALLATFSGVAADQYAPGTLLLGGIDTANQWK